LSTCLERSSNRSEKVYFTAVILEGLDIARQHVVKRLFGMFGAVEGIGDVVDIE